MLRLTSLSASIGPLQAIVLTAAVLAVASMSPAVSAQSALSVHEIIRLTSNYVYRGYTRSDNGPAVQGNLDVQHPSGGFVGGWISAVDFGGADLEFNPYLGGQIGLASDWRLAGMLAGYIYDRRVYGQRVDYGELSLLMAFRDTGSFRIAIAPDYYGSGHTALDYELELRHPLSDTIEVSGTLGYQASRKAVNDDMVYGNIGIVWYVRPELTLDLRYHDQRDVHEWSSSTGPYGILDENYLDHPVTLSLSLGF